VVLSALPDGKQMDLQYAAAKNKSNSAQQAEFNKMAVALVPPGERHSTVLRMMYEDYCDGLWIPTTGEVREMLLHVLKAENAAPGSTGLLTADLSDITAIPTAALPFEFENVAHEKLQTWEMFRQYGILAGMEHNSAFQTVPLVWPFLCFSLSK